MHQITPPWQEKIKDGECNCNTKVEFKCEYGHHNYFQSLDAHCRSVKKGFNGCPTCKKERAKRYQTRKEYPFMNEITEEYQEKIRNGEISSSEKAEFICLRQDVDHPNYIQELFSHFTSGCPICGNEKSRLSLVRSDYDFLDEVADEWKQKILNKECKSTTKVEFKCTILSHPNYMQTLYAHNSGQGCPICARKKMGRVKRTTYSFMDEITSEWQDRIRNGECDTNIKVEFVCKTHGNYYQSLDNHQHGQGCPECGASKRALSQRRTEYPFMEEIVPEWREKIHNGECSTHSKVEFICKKHGNYFQALASHSQGAGCPICKASKGEEYIQGYLIRNHISYDSQKFFDDCFHVIPLRFDFYIPLQIQPIAIEYQGRQHYEAVDYFGGKDAFALQQKRDNIKREYCKNNKINLIEIPYTDFDRIEEILNEIFAMDSLKLEPA